MAGKPKESKTPRVALITGITGQDGSYLAELLLAKGYIVYGVIRRTSIFNIDRIEHLYQDPHSPDYRMRLAYGDLTDGSRLLALLAETKPDEIYNLAAQSHVKVSFEQPEFTGNVDAMGVTRLLEAVRSLGLKPRIYQASSSEMFGNAPPPQSEDTPLMPRSPYAAAKTYAYWMCRNYREAYGMFIANGILFNHESPRRGPTFVTRKITRAVARISLGLEKKLYLGNLEAKRDWGYAPDYVEGMWRMLQHKEADDFVLATGEAHSVREFCEHAFDHVKLDWQKYVTCEKRYLRPAEVNHLQGDFSKARKVLGWKPNVTFAELVRVMVDADVEAIKSGKDEFRSEERWFK